MKHNYTYQGALENSQKVNWCIEDIIGGDKKIDFTKPLMPESLAGVTKVSFLTPQEQLTLNQIRGHEYLSMFGLVEEFILPFVVDHARPQLQGDDYRIRALLQFAGEEAKHIHLFKQFRKEFENDFDSPCQVIGPAEDISRFVILHIEWITLRHYMDSVKGDQELDPQFRSLLKNHWLEESQHTKLDTLIVEELVRNATRSQIDQAFEEYGEIGAFLDNGLQQQAEFDVDSFVKATGRNLSKSQRDELTAAVLKAVRWTYLGTGMTHPNFLATVEQIKPEARKQIEEMAPAFC